MLLEPLPPLPPLAAMPPMPPVSPVSSVRLEAGPDGMSATGSVIMRDDAGGFEFTQVAWSW